MTSRSSEAPVAILGAGFAGLTAAVELRQCGVPVVILERSSSIGGLSRSFRDKEGFTYDFGAHFITNRLAATLGLGAECRTVEHYREAVWLDGRTYSYPFGLVRNPRFTADALVSRLRPVTKAPGSAREVFERRFGRRLCDTVAAPLLEAWSGVPAGELAASVADKVATSLPMTMWLRMAGRLTHRAVAIGYCRELPESASVWHVYPKNGVGELVAKLASEVEDAITLDSHVEAIVVENERVKAVRVGGVEMPVRGVFSSAPLHILPKLIEGSSALEDLTQFRYRPMLFVNLKLQGRRLLPEIVTWTPSRKYPFFRLTEAPWSMPWLAPEGKTIVTADIGCEVNDETWKLSEEDATARVMDSITDFIPDASERLLGSSVMKTPMAYPVFMSSYEPLRQRLASSFPIAGLVQIGRNGEFEHLLMEDVYWRTRRATAKFMAELTSGQSSAAAIREGSWPRQENLQPLAP